MDNRLHLRHLPAFCLALLLVGGCATTAAGDVISTFDTNLNGWTLADNDPASTLNFVASGGNPGGYIVFSDGAQGADDVFSAPAQFLGVDSGFVNGTLSFDLAHNEPADNISFTPLVLLDAAGDSLSMILSAPTTSSDLSVWTHYSFSLTTGAGFVFDGGTNTSLGFNLSGGTAATAGEIAAVLGDVTAILIPADIHNGTELAALDNFALVSAVPEPSSWTLFAGCVAAGLVAFRRRFRTTV